MRPPIDKKISVHQATNLFLRLFEDYNYIKIASLLYGLDEYIGEYISRKEMILDLRIDPNDATRVLKGLRQLKLVDRKTENNQAFYKLKKENYQSLKQHYDFLTKKLVA